MVSSSRSGTNWFGAPTSHYRLGGRRYPRTGAKSASFRSPPSAIGWCKGRSSSSWSRYSRPISNRDRLDTVRRRQLMKRLTAWPRRSFSKRHASSTLICGATWMLRHTTPSVFLERVEEVRSSCRYLNSYAFCPSAIDVNGLKLAALYTLQDGLPRDAE